MPPADHDQPGGLEGAFLANRDALLRFLRARGAGDSAEDLLQDIWLKLKQARTGPVGAPLAYLYRVANTVMIDRYRSERQAARRERDWSETMAGSDPEVAEAPLPDRELIAREELARIAAALDGLGPRPSAVFRRHRIDGHSQRLVAQEFGVSVSTVEADLRAAYALIARIREAADEE